VAETPSGLASSLSAATGQKLMVRLVAVDATPGVEPAAEPGPLIHHGMQGAPLAEMVAEMATS